jgi:molecular chaperone GrpE
MAKIEKKHVDKEKDTDLSKVKDIKDGALESNKKEIASLREQLVEEKEKSQENYNKYLRVVADMDNLRKRFEREKRDIGEYSMEKFFRDLLPVLDSLNNVFSETKQESTSAEDFKSITKGLALIYKQFVTILESHGLESIEVKDQEFNPELHQALEKEEKDDIEKEIIKAEFVKGYKLNNRLLRAAMVSVYIPKDK